MRPAGVPVAALLLAASLLLLVSAEDIYWEGEEDASNEFLEVKEDESFAGRLMRMKRDLSFNPFNLLFGSTTSTTTEAPEAYESATGGRADELITDERDDDGDADGSGLPSFGDAEQREKTLRVSFVVMHPYQKEYSNRDSPEFQNFSKSLANAVTKLYQGNSEIHGSQRASLVRIQSRATDDFSCKVTLDIVSTGYDDMEKIKEILQEHIRYSRALDNLAVSDNDFNAKVIDPANGICASDEIRCGDEDCLPSSARCNSVPECSDGSDEVGCVQDSWGGRVHERPPVRDLPEDRGDVPTESPATPGNHEDCQSDQLKCDDTRCVPRNKLCDGFPDCHDGADERGCESCGADDFHCNDNKCIPNSARCNGIVECSSSEDEQGCDCKPGYFRCVQDGLCIEGRKRCDRVSHCRDGSDEANCPNADEYFRCSSGKYIPKYQRCNREYNCLPEDLSDEQNCQCNDGDFRCKNGYCIPASKHCDGTHDCQDKSDELECQYGTICMASYEYKCSSGECVRAEAVCNGTAECADGSDERACPCARDSFTCRDGPCLNIASLCNGQRDCPHGEDESNCGGQQCTAGQMACAPDTLVPCAFRCDGYPECAGGEDEAGCPEAGCELECDGQCLPSERICDGRTDCSDGSDEYQCHPCPGPDDFRCKSGECISNKHRCNSLPDCPDESDEKDCNQTITATPECRETDFPCLNNACVDIQFRCDGRNDCGDNSDEENCQRCDENQWQCRSNHCIYFNQHCDGYEDCPDSSDERDCPTTTTARPHTSCDANEWQCGSGECISLELQCNGRSDCLDRSDEDGCSAISHPNGPPLRTCDETQWQCRSGQCIYRMQRCDGYRNCADNSDENNCPTPAPVFPVESYPPARPEPQQPTTEREPYPPFRQNPDFGACDETQWQCRSGQCIYRMQRCDGYRNCADNSDENNCPTPAPVFPVESYPPARPEPQQPTTTEREPYPPFRQNPDFGACDETQWQCRSGQCIYRMQRCDGYRNCADNSDENNCSTPAPVFPVESYPPARPEPQQPTTTEREPYPPFRQNPDFGACDETQWQCRSGQCIYRMQRCDGYRNCADNSDENNCPTPAPVFPVESYPPARPEPQQPTTEREPYPPFRQNPDFGACDETQWQCRSGQCIYRMQRCDGYRNCADNSDENNCPTPAPVFPVESYPPARPEPQQPTTTEREPYPPFRQNPDFGECDDSQWRCRSGECIFRQLKCDGYRNCADNSDEYNCPPARPEPQQPTTTERAPYYPPPRPNPDFGGGCARNQWRCENGPCIDLARVCDGRVDCPRDRSDELDCPSSRPALLLKTYPDVQVVRHAKYQTGGDVVFQCRDEGPLRVPVRWVRENGRPLKPGSSDVRGRLEMSKVTVSDTGVYICQATGYLGQPGAELRVTLTVQTIPQQPAGNADAFINCQAHEATCGNGQCILKTAVCDGKPDCADRSDEDNCHHNGLCEPNQIRCANRRCVLKSWVCDSQDDCGDGTDERDCGQAAPGQPCLQTEFTCGDAQCIPKSFHCDGQDDCMDKSDEMGCAPVHVTKTPEPAHARLNPGETLRLHCEAVGVPTPLITWRLNWGHVPSKCTPTSYNGIGSLTCPNMQPEDSGAYSCEAINNKGTVFASPDSIVHVNRTDVCPSGTFNSEARSPRECISCFCFGESTQCKSADLFIYNMQTPLGLGGTRLVGVKQTYNGEVRLDSQSITDQYYYQSLRNGATVTKLETNGGYPAAAGPRSYPYLTLPEAYNGNQLTSYGGHIKYKLSPQSPRFNSGYDNMPDIIIKGKYGTLVYNRRSSAAREINIEARLTEAIWQKSRPSGLVPATREDIMMALDSVELILLRASVNDVGVNITDFVMESAQGLSVGLGSANLVEECTCPPGYEGLSCQKCSSGYVREDSGAWLGNCVREEPRSCPPGSYGAPAAGVACQSCPCPLTNNDNQFARTCSLGPRGNVICDCAQGYEGDNCGRCAPGYVGNPLIPGDSCQPRRASSCDPIGTYRINLPDECECKENVHGQYCNQCNNGSFHLSEDNSHGCALCFCTRNSQECTSSNLRRKTTSVVYNIPEMIEQVSVYESAPIAGAGTVRYDAPVPAALRPRLLRGELALAAPADRSRDTIYYWSLPPSFAGGLVTAYGGYLRYVLRNVPTSGIKNNAPDIQLIGDKNIRYHYFGGFDVSSDGTLTGTVRLVEKGWQRADGEEDPRDLFMMALADVKAILVKATRTSEFQTATLVSSSIDTAAADGTGPVAEEVEQCACPPGYVGTSCESCAPGYTRTSSGLYFKHCEPCHCNGHSDTCHPKTGVCSNCRDNTAGNGCEECRPGYEHDASGYCVRTRQDLPDDNCNCDPRGRSGPCDARGNCRCKLNVEGQSCEQCITGTFGLDQDNPEGCTPCYCSGVTRDCSEATTYGRYPIPVPIIGETNGDYTITDLNALQVFDNDMVSNVNESELTYIFKFEPSGDLYWSLPQLKGNMLLSYGGNLVLTQGFRSNDLYATTSTQGVDVVLVGDEHTVYWINPHTITSETPLRYRVPILERGWYIINDVTPASRNIFMSVLKNLRRVLVRATLTSKILSTSIADVQMDTATEGTGLPVAKGIEVCRCPPGYTGKSCESCAPGYYNQRGRCQLCPCNGHDCHAGTNNEVICDCRGQYSGRDCSRVADDQVTVTTRQPPSPQSTVTVIISNPSIKIENVGGTVNFTCEARSRMTQRPLPVNWTKVDGHLAQGRYLVDRRTGSLIITGVQESDSGTYVCQTQDGYSTGQAYATLTVGSNPITRPTVSITPSVNNYYEGERVELQCESNGNPTPEIMWQRANGQPLPISVQSTASYLVIDNVKLEDAGEYRCIARNSAGRASHVAAINVRPRPSRPSPDRLMIRPSSPNVVEGQSTNIICTGTASVPAGSIGWVRQDGAEFSSNVRTANGILYVDVARLENQGVYVCQTSTQQAASVPIVLSVISLNTPAPSERSNIQVNKKIVKIATGDSASINCNPSGEPLPDIQWIKYQGEFGPSTSPRGNTLTISNAQDDDQGYYVCIGSVDGTQIDKKYVMVEIETRIRPQVEIYPVGEQVAPLGGRVELTCRVLAGVPPPVITWSRGRGRLQEISRFTEILPHNTLTFQQVEVNDEGEYICTASNSAGSVSANATLKVRSRPVITITPKSYFELNRGEGVQLQCRASGYPEPMVSIKNKNGAVVVSGLSIASLSIPEVSDGDAGDYTCVATSAAGTEQDQFAIRVGRGDAGFPQYGEGSGENEFDDPYEHGTPSDMIITAAEGQDRIIACEGPSEFEVRWSRVDRQPLQRNAYQNGNELIIRNASKSDSGQYECVKVDRRTGYEQQATFTELRVLAPPRITLRPPTQTVRPGQSPTVECVVEGDGDLDVFWQPDQKPFSSRVQPRGTTLIFRQIEVEDAGRYVCYARNKAANASATAQVIVSEETDRAASHANEQVAHVGASVRFGCNVSQPHLAVSWTKDGRALPRSVRQLPGGWLYIKLVKKSDSGRYVCIIRDRYGRTTNNYINLHIEGIECLETQFSCTDGNGCIDKKLRCDGSNDCENYSDEDNCPNTERPFSDYPTYTGSRGEDPALVVIDQPRRSFTVDEDVRVLCRTSSSDVHVWWEKIGTPEHVEHRAYGDGSMLIIPRAAESDSGVYRCIGDKPYSGRSYDDFTLEVIPGPRGPSYPDSNQDETYTARLGEPVDIPCPHDLEGPVSYEWRLEFSSLPSYVRPYERNLYLNSVSEADAGTYICSARNERTSTEARVVLLVTGVVRQFSGASWIAMRTLEDAYLRLDIEISFKPTDYNGLILYNGENEGPYGNFIALQLLNGYPQMTIGTSSSPVIVQGDQPLSLNTWHTIRLSRMYTKVSMNVDDTGPFTSEISQHHTMDLQQPLYIGGVPDFRQLPPALAATSGFVGCVGMLILGKQENDIIRNSIRSNDVSPCNTCAPNLCLNRGICQEARNERGYVCLCPRGFAGRDCDHAGEGCRPRICGPGKCTETADSYKCSCPITYTGPNCNIRQTIEYPAFTGSAYLAIKPPVTTRSLHMSMKVRAMSPVTDGIIVYCAESELGYGGFTVLAVREGRLEFRYQVGEGSNPVILTSRYLFAANEWTEVNISRVGGYVSLHINPSNEEVSGSLANSKEQQRLTTALYVGGVDDSNIVLNNNTGVSGGFSGCIKDVIVQEGPIDIVNASIVSANVQECTQHDIRGDIPEDANVCSQCGPHGYCTSAESSSCVCLDGYTGVYCDDRVPQSTRRAPAASDPCARRPCLHNGTCRPGRRDPTSNLNYTCDCPLGFSGATCQIPLMLDVDVHFSGIGYLELPAELLDYSHDDPALIALAMNISSDDAILLYQWEQSAGGRGDYILLRVEHGHVVFELDKGAGSMSVAIEDIYVSNRDRHQIVVRMYRNNTVELQVDHRAKSEWYQGISNVMNADSNIYLGGVPEWLNEWRIPGLTGCVLDVEFTNMEKSLNFTQAVAGRNAHRCRDQRP